MKSFILLIVLTLSPIYCNAQLLEVAEGEKKIYICNTPFDYSKDYCYGKDCYYQIPYYPEKAKYISQNLRYPVVCAENGIQGDVFISFFVERDGGLSNVKLEKGTDPALNKEALRLINGMPKWLPGKIDGKIVRTKYTARFTFRLM